MNGFEKRREMKKAAIRRAALQLFQEYGIKKVSITEIASRAEVSPASIYNFFNSKDELANEVIRDLFSQSVREIEEIISRNVPFPEKLQMLIRAKGEAAGYLQGSFVEQLISRNSELQHDLQEIEGRINALIKSFFSQGRSEDCVRSDVADKTLFYYFNIFRQGMGSYQEVLKNDTELTGELIKLFFTAVLKDR